jgi:ornithine cyclodeaminase
MRTAAANAVAAKYLSNPQASQLAVFGAGSQARFEVEALCRVRPIEQVNIVNRTPEKAEGFAQELTLKGLKASVCSAKKALENAQLITTVTASRDALFESRWVNPGTHISAMGSDAPGNKKYPPLYWSVHTCTVIIWFNQLK